MFTVPVAVLYTAQPVVVETLPPEMFTVPDKGLLIADPVVDETVPPEMVTVPPDALLYTALLVVVLPVFVISAVLVTEMSLATCIVPVVSTAEVIFPFNVTAPHVPPVLLKLADAVPMFNAVVLLLNCMVLALPAAWVLMALITACIG